MVFYLRSIVPRLYSIVPFHPQILRGELRIQQLLMLNVVSKHKEERSKKEGKANVRKEWVRTYVSWGREGEVALGNSRERELELGKFEGD